MFCNQFQKFMHWERERERENERDTWNQKTILCYAADHAAVTALITFCFSPVANSNITCLCADQTVADLGSGLQTTKADVESLKASQKTLTTQLEALNNRLSLLEVGFLALGLSPCLFVRLPFLGIICLVVGFGKIHSALALKVFVKKNPTTTKNCKHFSHSCNVRADRFQTDSQSESFQVHRWKRCV